MLFDAQRIAEFFSVHPRWLAHVGYRWELESHEPAVTLPTEGWMAYLFWRFDRHEITLIELGEAVDALLRAERERRRR